MHHQRHYTTHYGHAQHKQGDKSIRKAILCEQTKTILFRTKVIDKFCIFFQFVRPVSGDGFDCMHGGQLVGCTWLATLSTTGAQHTAHCRLHVLLNLPIICPLGPLCFVVGRRSLSIIA